MREQAIGTARSQKSTILLDFDGTVCRTANAVKFSLKASFRHLGFAIPNRDILQHAVCHGAPLQETIRLAHPGSPSREEITGLKTGYRKAHRQEGYRYETMFAGAQLALRECANYARIVIPANKGLEAIEASRLCFGLRQYIAAFMGERPGAPAKPDAQLFDAVLRHVQGVRRNRALVVGDSESDLEFARNAGLKSCWAVSGYGNQSRCKDIGFDFAIKRLEDLPWVVLRWSSMHVRT